MGKFKIAIASLETNQSITVKGRNTINKIDRFLRNNLRVSYSTGPKDDGIEFKLFYPLSDEARERTREAAHIKTCEKN
jgi:hypothetical protein